VWLVTQTNGALAVLGYIDVPSDTPLVSNIGWVSDTHLVVGSKAGKPYSSLVRLIEFCNTQL